MPLKNYDDKINKEFGRLMIISIDKHIEKGQRRECTVRCLECNKNKKLKLHKVLEGNYQSCGCLSRKRKNMKRTNYNDYIGKTFFGYKIVTHNKERKLLEAHCLECGEHKNFDRYKLINGLYGECECKRFHKQSKTDLYNRWKGIKNRCLNPNATAYKDYGGRGINVCERWKKDFTNFLKDMGEPPTKHHQLDRIDNDGDYEPSNCRWVLSLQNNNNQRKRKSNKTGYPNVYRKREKFESCFQFNKKYYHVGTFESAKEAYEACMKAKAKFLNSVNYNDIV
ncbi:MULTISPECIES: AP2 domain-containing protein [Staphylococcus]|uniref:AP2 domain-containing protein n=1 Tax=Staphylococcus TaxID=1279 RepID=UPI00069E41AC|nr:MULTISPECIES: AP2 domain-containing protein [Staphylococcus]OHO94463.1 hypothetical protein HMPREF2563_06795 [Staphylococcus sp. HMSC057G10]